jgi:hypothetical protein
MRRIFARCFLTLTLALTLVMLSGSGLAPQYVSAQSDTITYQTTTLFRCRVSDLYGGYYLTAIGSNCNSDRLNYTMQGSLDDNHNTEGLFAGIFLPPPGGYHVAPNMPPYMPLHQWRVVEGGRTYYWYSTYLSTTLGPNYHYESVVGYVLHADYDPNNRPAGTPAVNSVPVNYYYSKKFGYWFTTRRPEFGGAGCFPDNCNVGNTSFKFQGIGFRMPARDSVRPASDCGFNDENLQRCPTITYVRDETLPPPTCDTAQEQSCYDSGGFWNQSTCSCSFLEPPPDPEPCRPGMICQMQSPTQQTAKPVPKTQPQE